MVQALKKSVYETSIMADYFKEDELIKKTGLKKEEWNFVILKELIDNALDAIEPLSEKQIFLRYFTDKKNRKNILQIFDNGSGISVETVNRIYNFSNYVSDKRHIITPSRGKQGNGLKTIISICYLMDYKLLWHTSDGVIIENIVDVTEIDKGILKFNSVEHGKTEERGIEIIGYENIRLNKSIFMEDIISRYSRCNPDVHFYVKDFYSEKQFFGDADVADKTKNSSISFYDYHTFMRLILDTQDGNTTYKQFLGDFFGTRIKNKSMIKGKIKDIDFANDEFKTDFMQLKTCQTSKQYTILKKHTLGFRYTLETEYTVQKLKGDLDIGTTVPCLVEFDVQKINTKNDPRYLAECECFVNNTLTYNNGFSIVFDEGYYDIGTRKMSSSRYLAGLLSQYNDYKFAFHFISPYFIFKDAGKTEIDISCFIKELCRELKKAISKEKRIYDANIGKPISNTKLMRPYMDMSFNIASTNGKYSITARQMWYKLREITGVSESAYNTFTQSLLTEWINKNPQYEDKINFANRGVFYVGNSQDGLGTANVRKFINNLDSSTNTFLCYGGVNNTIYIDDDFNIEYKYDKALYIEKTGFDDIFKVEKIGEKYNMIIISGQGFSTRAAKTMLYALQERGLKLYCMHDLDVAGFNILSSFRNPNDKFEHVIEIEDLGITIDDVKKYNITPERVEKGKDMVSSMPEEYQRFFDQGDYYYRVELNAFTTEQILEIMDDKLSKVNNLPTIDLKESFEVDHEALRNVAFMKAMQEKYASQLSEIHIPIDLSAYKGLYTVDEAKKEIPEIKNELISKYENAIKEKLNIF